MNFREKIETIDSIIEQDKAQYNLGRQTAGIQALSSGNIGKNDFLTGNILPEKGLLEKAATIKRFEYSPFDTELKKDQHKINCKRSIQAF